MSQTTAIVRTTMHACFPARPTIFLLAVGFLASGARATDAEFSWVPVDASVAFTTAQPDSAGIDTEMITTATSSPLIVEFEIRVNGWASAPGAPTVGTAQAGVDATGFLGANASPANPGVDLTPLNNQPWRENPGGNGYYDSAFMVTYTCHETTPPDFTDTGKPCASVPPIITWNPCPNGTSCSDKDNFLFWGIMAIPSVATSTPNFAWGAFALGSCPADAGISYYLGTLVLDVPAGAKGTYTIGFDPAQSATILNDCSGSAIPDLTLTPGHLTLQTGYCCTIIAGSAVCTDDVLEEDCPGFSWIRGGTCADVPCPCGGCISDSACGDFNVCTDDSCNVAIGCLCENTPNFDTEVWCCHPWTGELTGLDDGDPCTLDVCNVQTGQITHPPSCVDGNACTNDACLPDGSCSNPINYNRTTECCNPSSGAVSQISDGAVCTLDVCDVATGEVTHPVLPECEVGACCNPDGSCADSNPPQTCLARAGSFQGAMTACAQITCPEVLGACCDTGGGCAGRTLFDCALLGNSGWAGTNTTCADTFDPTEIMGVTCGDGLDNDCDGQTDCADSDCGADCAMPLATPLGPPFPHDRRKNRYISFDPNKAVNDGSNIAFKVELKAITLGSCNGPAGDPPQIDFCREDRKRCSISGSSCSDDGDCDAGEGTCSVWSDCNTCVGAPAENACINQPIDCGTNGTCTPTGETCVNDVPNVGGSNVGRAWWAGPESPLGNGVHLMVSKPFRKVSTDWASPTHVGDCEIVPEAVYGVRAINVDTSAESDELVVETTLFASISSSSWGDCVGTLERFCGGDIRTPACTSDADCTVPQTCDQAWMLPDGSVNFDDIGAALALVAPGPARTPPPMTWVDLHGNASGTPGSQNFDPPNGVLNFSDIGQILSGFGGLPYKGYDPADCPDESDWT